MLLFDRIVISVRPIFPTAAAQISHVQKATTVHKEIVVPEIVDSFGSSVTLFTAIKHFTGITDSLYQAQYLLLLGVGTCRPLISPFKLRHLPFVQSLDFYHNILEFTL